MKKILLTVLVMCFCGGLYAATYYDSSVISVLELENNVTDLYPTYTAYNNGAVPYSAVIYKYGSYSAGLFSAGKSITSTATNYKTVEFYIYVSSTATTGTDVPFATTVGAGAGNDNIAFDKSTNKIFYSNSATKRVITRGEWHHLAVTRDGTNVRFYTDNSILNTILDSKYFTAPYFGAYTTGAFPFPGYIDRIVISNVVKTSFPSLPEHTATPSITMTVTPTITQTVTQTITPTITKTVTQTVTKTVTATVTPTITPTATPTNTPWPDYILNLPVIKDPWYRGPWFPWLDKNPRTPRNRK
jgi:hypothetical protein